ncbi:MAG: hypothetical protein QME52_03035 [Bacteroidota bacterium]|nr:hypothetical protein [Bacteroidota bacterium]
MKKIFLLFFVILSTISTINAIEPEKENKDVKVEFSLKQKTVNAGATGELLITFKTKKDIHINLDPPMKVKLDSTDVIATVGKLILPKTGKSEYLDISKPVKLQFGISKKAKPGTIRLRGLLTYFYCSGTDGLCSRVKQPIDISLIVSK